MKRSILLIALFLLSAVSYAITRSNLVSYSSALNGKKKAELKAAAYAIMQQNLSTLAYGSGYKKTWWGFYQTDRIASTNECINRYSATKFYFGDSNTGTAISGMNIEHSFPKSWWGGSENNAYKDLNNLYPSDTQANSDKSNYPMGIVETLNSGGDGYDKVGKGTIDGVSGRWCWEPGDQYKGDFSRVYMYMATTYQNLTWAGTQGLQQLQNDEWPTLKQWAYTLYMQWVRNDPVSTLEIDRNNAVSGIQNNRNLFIDYPYLAEYIWGDSINVAFNPYTSITTASDDNRYNGGTIPTTPSISLNQTSASVVEGNTITLTATTQNAGNATVTWTSSNTNVATVSGGVVTGVAAGSAIITASITVSGTNYTATCNVTVTSGTTTQGDYVKVTSAPSDWSGTYLIVCESLNLAMNGALTADQVDNTISVTISNSSIPSNTTTDAASFTITQSGDMFYIKGAGGSYIGGKSNTNTVVYSTSAINNSISISDGNAVITSNSTYLRYRNESGQTRFRYFKTANYEAIQLYKKTASTPVTPSITLSETSVTEEVGNSFTLTATTQNANGATVTWTSDNTNVATVTNGVVTCVAAGSATITAKITVSGNTYSATCSITVVDNSTPGGDGTLENPYSVAEVLALFASNNVSTSNVYVKGIISEISEVSTQYGNASYYISDEGTTNNQFYVYRGKYLDNVRFTSNDQIQVGDTVVIYGTLTTYGTTNEFAANNYIVSIVHPSTTLLGDVNKDGEISIADVTALVNIILGKDTENLYDHVAADVNEDEDISIADVTALVNRILGKTN